MYNRHERNDEGIEIIKMIAVISAVLLLCVCYFFVIKRELDKIPDKTVETVSNAPVKEEVIETKKVPEKEVIEKPSWINEDIIEVNEYSRPGTKLEGVNAIVIHYTGNPGTTAEQHRRYYAKLANTHERSVSSHFVVGSDGDVVQCVPTDEVAYASNDRNSDTLSIEVCHEDSTGKFSDDAYDKTVKLTAYLLKEFRLGEDGIIRHYDVTGKICPKYYVENEAAWLKFKSDVMEVLENDSWKL